MSSNVAIKEILNDGLQHILFVIILSLIQNRPLQQSGSIPSECVIVHSYFLKWDWLLCYLEGGRLGSSIGEGQEAVAGLLWQLHHFSTGAVPHIADQGDALLQVHF